MIIEKKLREMFDSQIISKINLNIEGLSVYSHPTNLCYNIIVSSMEFGDKKDAINYLENKNFIFNQKDYVVILNNCKNVILINSEVINRLLKSLIKPLN